jgi:hypothetical protein
MNTPMGLNRDNATTNGRLADYTANNLNQYTSREVPGYIDVSVSIGRISGYSHQFVSDSTWGQPKLDNGQTTIPPTTPGLDHRFKNFDPNTNVGFDHPRRGPGLAMSWKGYMFIVSRCEATKTAFVHDGFTWGWEYKRK